MDDERWDIIQNQKQILTVRFSYPTVFRKALAASLGRTGLYATLPEVEEFIREAVSVNVEACIQDHLASQRPKLRARIRRSSS